MPSTNFGVHEDAIPRIESSIGKLQQLVSLHDEVLHDILSMQEEGLISGEVAASLTAKFGSDTKIQKENINNMVGMLTQNKTAFSDILEAAGRLSQSMQQ